VRVFAADDLFGVRARGDDGGPDPPLHVLSEPEWAAKLTERDVRGLTPLFWGNVLLHGVFAIDLDKRLDYDRVPDPGVEGHGDLDDYLPDDDAVAIADDGAVPAWQ